MDVKEREISEKALKHIFIGSQLDGVKFGVGAGAILIQFMHYTNQQPEDLWINIETRWTVFPPGVKDYPNSEGELEELTEEEEYHLLFLLRRDKVVDVQMGELAPHLHIVFQSGQTMFVNGHHEMYECWQAGDGAWYTGEEWLVVAGPGDSITTWSPEDF
ncbi:hypothetical protein [Bacillus sp. OV166]|uniref:hypothetical protein n=1 Tax=Bacillus sp. OV166 TaxID=1882763 RepID=UPI0011552708|nr:hypothetical protein [Bacillus sp. OV166]